MKKEEIKLRIAEILQENETDVIIHGSVVGRLCPSHYEMVADEIINFFNQDIPGRITEDNVNEYFKNK